MGQSDGGSIPHGKGQIFEGEWASHCKVEGHSTVVCGKTAERIEMPFGLWAPMGPRNRVLHGGSDPSWEGPILGNGSPIVKYRDFLLCAVQIG